MRLAVGRDGATRLRLGGSNSRQEEAWARAGSVRGGEEGEEGEGSGDAAVQ